MFIDRVKVFAKAGDGGKGAVAFRREAFVPKGGPSGGNGGRGGDVILESDHDLNNLIAQYYAPRLIAQKGEAGKGKGMDGHAGKDRVVKVPCGTLVWRLACSQTAAAAELMADLVEHGQRFVLCKGGRGGLGNRHFATATHQTPRFAQPGEPGEVGEFLLELRMIADVGLVGYPNAGKSTLVSVISRAHPKVAAYPFTTLHPQIGIVEYPDYYRLTVCDLPGLIEGAHRNVGLGHQFLRHVERCKVLVLLLDMAGLDGRWPWDDYEQVLEELRLYNPILLQRARLVVANKMDEPSARENLKQFRRKIRKTPVLSMAAAFDVGIAEFKKAMRRVVEAAKAGPGSLAGPVLRS